MPGTIYRALAKSPYDWSSVPASGSLTHNYVAKGIDVSAYREFTLIVRLHTVNIVGASSAPSITVNVYAEAPTGEDPATDFILTSAAVAQQVINLSPTSTAPQVWLVQGSTPFGSTLRVEVKPAQSATQATTFQASLSIDIVAKS